MTRLGHKLLGCTIAAALATAPGVSLAEQATVVVSQAAGVDAALAKRITQQVRRHRTVLPIRPLPDLHASPEEVAHQDRVTAIARALDRARRHEEVAAWDACTKEAGDRLGDATEILATRHELGLLRDLHLQIGACLSLSASPEDAQPHFRTATLLDERAPAKGRHRQEAEVALDRARDEVLSRRRGPVHIETDPPGAEVWLDGNKLAGTTPLEASVRLGAHFITLRRFRHEPQTTQAMMQPGSGLRFVLAPAQRDSLRRQLAEVRAGKRSPSKKELRLARATFSGARELVVLRPATGPTKASMIRVEVLESESGAAIRSQLIPSGADDDDLEDRMCSALAASCPEESGGIPWYIWPIAGVALTGGAVAVGFYLDSQRGTAFCAAGGC